MRYWIGTIVLTIGLVLLVASLGQYGLMAYRQRQLQQRWNAINTPAGAGSHPGVARGVRLIIPSIHLDDVVVRGTTYEDLLVAPGLLQGSPLPGDGGNTVIAGHRDTFFRHVADLHQGDRIEVKSRGKEYDYRVVKRLIVKPTDTWVLANTPAPQLTLVTCYPTFWIGPAPKRLIVQASSTTGSRAVSP